MKITAIAIALLVLIGVSAPTSASERHYGLRATGTTAEDLLAEMRRHVPLKAPNYNPGKNFDYVVLLATVAEERHVRGTQCRIYPAWGEYVLDIERIEYIRSPRTYPIVEAGDPEQLVVVARLAKYRNAEGHVGGGSYGTGAERHNRLQPGDRAIMVAIRYYDQGNGNPYSTGSIFYCPDFWPKYSLVYSAIVKMDDEPPSVCVVASSGMDSRRPDSVGEPFTLVSQSEFSRELHCYDVSSARAFDLILRTVRDGAIQW